MGNGEGGGINIRLETVIGSAVLIAIFVGWGIAYQRMWSEIEAVKEDHQVVLGDHDVLRQHEFRITANDKRIDNLIERAAKMEEALADLKIIRRDLQRLIDTHEAAPGGTVKVPGKAN